jgi:predicted pyridoxine 5'-phosphate oxidase superfamily flavin-nucleotide-binding protein
MAYSFLDIARTPSVIAAQKENGSAELYGRPDIPRDFTHFTPKEAAFIAERDSFYLATVSETGWPYVQHRGGPAGFLRLLDERTLAFSDYRGNRQYISLGNASVNPRVSLFLMDYPNRRRLKIYARMETRQLDADAALSAATASPGYPGKAERVILFHLEAFDWNCPQHITPRFSETEMVQALEPVRIRIEQLEAENARLRERLGEAPL